METMSAVATADTSWQGGFLLILLGVGMKIRCETAFDEIVCFES
jgi:hypothetical protein